MTNITDSLYRDPPVERSMALFSFAQRQSIILSLAASVDLDGEHWLADDVRGLVDKYRDDYVKNVFAINTRPGSGLLGVVRRWRYVFTGEYPDP